MSSLITPLHVTIRGWRVAASTMHAAHATCVLLLCSLAQDNPAGQKQPLAMVGCAVMGFWDLSKLKGYHNCMSDVCARWGSTAVWLLTSEPSTSPVPLSCAAAERAPGQVPAGAALASGLVSRPCRHTVVVVVKTQGFGKRRKRRRA